MRPRPPLADGAIVVGLFVLALAFQLPIFDRWIAYSDEGLVAQTATEINRGKVIYRDVIMPLPGPASFYLLAGVFRLTGPSFRAERLTIAVMSSAMAAMLYLLARGAVPRAPAVLVGLGFLVCRLWAFPHWLFFHYASCAGFFATLAYTLLLPSLGRRRLVMAALAGAAGGVALLAKQDVGGASLAGVGIAAVLLSARGDRLATLAAVGAGAAAIVVPVLAAFAAAGALGALLDQAVWTAFRGFAQFAYLPLPNVSPLLHQDPALRARIFEYAPAILITLYRDAVLGGSLYRTTAVWDVAIKLCYFLPYILLPAAAVVVGRSWLSADPSPADRIRRAGASLGIVFAATTFAAENPPHDWVHHLVLYHPTLLLGGLLLDRAAGRAGSWRRRAVLATATVAVLGGLAVTLRLERDLRRAHDTPVATPAGTVRVPPGEALMLSDLFGYLQRETAPTDPLPVIPYHPLIEFLAGRTAGLSNYFFWPVRSRGDTDARLIGDLEATRPRRILYSPSQYTQLGRFRDNFPDLFAHLVDRYEIVRTFTPPGWGSVFCALAPRPPRPAPLVDLAGALEGATVSVAGRPLAGEERAAAAGRALWPFQRVLYERPTFGGATRIAFRLRVPADARLRFGYGMDPDQWVSFAPAAVTFEVVVTAPDGGERRLFSGTVDAQRQPSERAWREADIGLEDLAGAEVTLTFLASTDAPAGERPDLAGWADPRIEAPAR